MANFLDKVVVSDGRADKRKREKDVAQLWGIWCEETGRRDEIVDDARDCFEYWLNDGYELAQLAYIVSAAARMKPVRHDRHDVKRVIRALEDEDYEHQASQAYESGREVYPYTPYREKLLIMRDELADLLDDEDSSWDEEDEEHALWIMAKMSAEDVHQLRDDIESAGMWEIPMSPTMFRSFKRKRKWREQIGSNAHPKQMTNAGATNSYEQGAKEAQSLEDVDFSVDPESNALFVRTRSKRRVVNFHNQAPAGYWEEVGRIMDEEERPVEVAYDDLVEEFDWHPCDRRDG